MKGWTLAYPYVYGEKPEIEFPFTNRNQLRTKSKRKKTMWFRFFSGGTLCNRENSNQGHGKLPGDSLGWVRFLINSISIFVSANLKFARKYVQVHHQTSDFRPAANKNTMNGNSRVDRSSVRIQKGGWQFVSRLFFFSGNVFVMQSVLSGISGTFK